MILRELSTTIYIFSLFFCQDLHDMTEISVQNNPITQLQGFALAGIRNVTNLYLGYNRLNRIDA